MTEAGGKEGAIDISRTLVAQMYATLTLDLILRVRYVMQVVKVCSGQGRAEQNKPEAIGTEVLLIPLLSRKLYTGY